MNTSRLLEEQGWHTQDWNGIGSRGGMEGGSCGEGRGGVRMVGGGRGAGINRGERVFV